MRGNLVPINRKSSGDTPPSPGGGIASILKVDAVLTESIDLENDSPSLAQLDGMTPEANKTVLVFLQNDTIENGIYTLNDLGGGEFRLTRSSLLDSSAKLNALKIVIVLGGQRYAQNIFYIATNTTLVLNTDGIYFNQVGPGRDTTIYTVEVGLDESGDLVDIISPAIPILKAGIILGTAISASQEWVGGYVDAKVRINGVEETAEELDLVLDGSDPVGNYQHLLRKINIGDVPAHYFVTPFSYAADGIVQLAQPAIVDFKVNANNFAPVPAVIKLSLLVCHTYDFPL